MKWIELDGTEKNRPPSFDDLIVIEKLPNGTQRLVWGDYLVWWRAMDLFYDSQKTHKKRNAGLMKDDWDVHVVNATHWMFLDDYISFYETHALTQIVNAQ